MPSACRSRTSTAAGKAFFDMLGVFAEFETNLRRNGQEHAVAKVPLCGRTFAPDIATLVG
ncbi:hypothetical protein EME01_62620 [Sinorhizobium meliloti]|nr:hypothetical protein EME01_62620 [Sinorhizobium meliloti]